MKYQEKELSMQNGKLLFLKILCLQRNGPRHKCQESLNSDGSDMKGNITTSSTDQAVVSDTEFQNIFGKLQKLRKQELRP